MKIKKMIISICFLFILVSCSNSEEALVQETDTKQPVKHVYHSIGDEVDAISYTYKIHSAKVTDSIPISEGDKWILLDVTLTDVDGSDYSIDEFAILYGDFILLDDEDNIYYRSEEHTSELQSRENLVCRLLLVKKTYV